MSPYEVLKPGPSPYCDDKEINAIRGDCTVWDERLSMRWAEMRSSLRAETTLAHR